MNNLPTPDEEGQLRSAYSDARLRAIAREYHDAFANWPPPQPPPVMPPSVAWRVLRIANVAFAYAVIAVTLDTTLHIGIVLTVIGGIPAGVLVNQWYEEDRW
jgi:hypothetical protein